MRRIDPELGEEKLCRGCSEFWPLDDEFWYFQERDGKRHVLGRCRACWSDRFRNPEGRRFAPLAS